MVMVKPKVTRSRDHNELEEAQRIASIIERGRMEFYARMGMEPPPKPEVPAGDSCYSDLPEEDDFGGRPRGRRASAITARCARPECGVEFPLTRHQRTKYHEGQRGFYCTHECYRIHLGTKAKGRTRAHREANARIPVAIVREEVLRQIESGQITWVELAMAMNMTMKSRHDPNKRYADSTRVKRALGIKSKRGNGRTVENLKLTEGINRDTARRFAAVLGVNPEVWGLDASTE